MTVNRWNGNATLIVEPVVRVRDCVADKVIGASMEAVGAGTGDHVNDRGTGKAVLRAEVGLLHFELFHRFR